MQITAFCQPSQLEATTHALISVDNSKHHSSAICGLSEGGKIHVFSRDIDNSDPKSPYATSTFPIMHLICPQILHNLCFSFLLGITAVPREIENNAYAKFWGANKVPYVENVEMANESVQHAALSHRVSWKHAMTRERDERPIWPFRIWRFMVYRYAVLWCGRSFWVDTAHSNFPCFALCRKATPNNGKENRIKWPWIEHRLHRKGSKKPKFT